MGRREAWKEILLSSKRKGLLTPEFLAMTDEELMKFVDEVEDRLEQKRSQTSKNEKSIPM